MLEGFLRFLAELYTQGKLQDWMPLIALIIHSRELEEAVRRSATPMDDVLLRVLRAVIPAPGHRPP